MNDDPRQSDFLGRLSRLNLESNRSTRVLALYSVGIALADKQAQRGVIEVGQEAGLAREVFYEIMLQSYLFLGFPRMLTAAEHLDAFWPSGEAQSPQGVVSGEEAARWFERGTQLCRRVYAGNFDKLKNRVESMAPEVFRWMIFEGYGKVLSRNGVSPVDRELAIVACLIADNRPKQMLSHMMGTLNVGGDIALLRTMVDDLGPAFGEGYQNALNNLGRLEND